MKSLLARKSWQISSRFQPRLLLPDIRAALASAASTMPRWVARYSSSSVPGSSARKAENGMNASAWPLAALTLLMIRS